MSSNLAILDGNGYGVSVSQALEARTSRVIAFGTVHNTLIRLEEKGFVTSHLGGATAERGGRRKRLFRVTALGSLALQHIKQIRRKLWPQMPSKSLQLNSL